MRWLSTIRDHISSVRLEQSSSGAETACREVAAFRSSLDGRVLGCARTLLETNGGRGLLIAIALAGCSGGSPDYNRVDVPEREAEAQAAIEQSVARNGAASTALTGVPVEKSAQTAARARAFPTEFLGYWGVTDDDCELAKTNATGRINIDADTIRFHESRARVQRLVPLSPQEVVADLRIAGEGQAFQRRETYRLEAGGTVLVRITPPTTQRYRRC